MRLRPACLAAALVIAVLGLARATDVQLAGSKLVLRKKPASERLVLLARGGVIAPLPGSTEDPTLVGGELQIVNPGTGEQARFATSARDWSVNTLGTVYRFQNRLETGPGSEVRSILIRNRGRLKISTRALGITLDEQAQRALSVVMRTGTRRYCFLFGGRIGKDKPGRFVAHKAPAPSACPGPIVGASTTTTSRPPSTGPTSTSVTSSTRPTTPTTSSTTAPPNPTTTTSTSTTSTSTQPTVSTTSSTTAPTTPTTSSTTATANPTTSTSTSTTSSTTQPTVSTTSSTRPPTSSTTVPTTTTTTTTDGGSCGFRGNSCKGTCPSGRRCASLLGGVCACVLQ